LFRNCISYKIGNSIYKQKFMLEIIRILYHWQEIFFLSQKQKKLDCHMMIFKYNQKWDNYKHSFFVLLLITQTANNFPVGCL
jgi:hypothetical protein